jgi:hypothetical protein
MCHLHVPPILLPAFGEFIVLVTAKLKAAKSSAETGA